MVAGTRSSGHGTTSVVSAAAVGVSGNFGESRAAVHTGMLSRGHIACVGIVSAEVGVKSAFKNVNHCYVKTYLLTLLILQDTEK